MMTPSEATPGCTHKSLTEIWALQQHINEHKAFNWKICTIYSVTPDDSLPSVWELVISVSSPVNPPSLLKWTDQSLDVIGGEITDT